MNNVNVELFGKDPKITKAIESSRNIAVTKAAVLIVGEVGVGKRSLAQYIHESSGRASQSTFTVDCANEALVVENEILGYREESTGRFVKGVIESANGGTIILANIDCLEDSFQKRLHKILGELDDYDIDVRIIATTTKNLSKLVGSGRFYRGLYTVVSSNSITLSPLRERPGDLEAMAKHYISSFSKDENLGIEDKAMAKILNHYWTHNVQELKIVIESSVSNITEGQLLEEHLEIGERKIVSMINDDDNEGIRLMSLKEAEKLLIKKALIHTSENRTQAAKILGVSIRTLRNKINEYRNGGSAYFVNLR